jgi:hypothetical protein
MRTTRLANQEPIDELWTSGVDLWVRACQDRTERRREGNERGLTIWIREHLVDRHYAADVDAKVRRRYHGFETFSA